MAAEENPTAPLAGGPDPSAEDRMTILQRRLAEIQGTAAEPVATTAPATTPEASEAPVTLAAAPSPAASTELPADQSATLQFY